MVGKRVVCTVLSRVVRDLKQFFPSCSMNPSWHKLLWSLVRKKGAKCLECGEALHFLLLNAGVAKSPRAAEISLGLRPKKEK